MLNFAELHGQLKSRDNDVFEKALRYVLEYSDPLGSPRSRAVAPYVQYFWT